MSIHYLTGIFSIDGERKCLSKIGIVEGRLRYNRINLNLIIFAIITNLSFNSNNVNSINQEELPNDCGQFTRMVGRISGGENISEGEYPSYAYLLLGDHYCGGTIISDRYVLTSAHCLAAGWKGSIFPTFKNPNKYYDMKEYIIEKGCQSKEYIKKRTYSNYDLAVLRTKTKIEFDYKVQPACLPSVDIFENEKSKRPFYAVGLGSMNEFGILPDVVQGIFLKQIPCSTRTRHKSKYCLRSRDGLNTGSICLGDSGGPVYTLMNGKQTVVGITSYGDIDCKLGAVGLSVTTNVFNVRDSIDELLRECR